MANRPLAEAAVQVVGDYSRFDGDFERRVRRSGRRAGKALDDEVRDSAKKTGRRAGKALGKELADNASQRARDSKGRFVKAGEEGAKQYVAGFRAQFRRTFQVTLSRALLSALFAPVAGLGATVGLATLTTGIAALSAALVELAAAAAPAVGILAALPAATAAGAAAIGTLALALHGIGDAFSAALGDDVEEFEESLEQLSPAARTVAREIRSLRPAFLELRNAVQDAYFAPLVGQFRELAEAVSGPLQRGMTNVAKSMGQAARQTFAFAATKDSVQAIGVVFASLNKSIRTLSTALAPFLAGLRALTVAAAPALQPMAAALADIARSFGAWMSEAARSGQALEWIQNARVVLGQLGDILRNLVGSVNALFAAARQASGDVLVSLVQLTAHLREFLSSAEGQQALVTIFTALRDLLHALQPALSAAAGAIADIGPVFSALTVAAAPGLEALIQGIGRLISAVGPGLIDLTAGLSQGLRTLVPALQPLGRAVGQILSALTPLISLIAELASSISNLLLDALEVILPILRPVVSAIADSLIPVMPELSKAIRQVTVALEPLAAALGQGLGDLIRQLIPPIVQLSPMLVEALVPAVRQLTTAITPVIPLLIDLLVTAIKPLLDKLPDLIPALQQIATAFAEIYTVLAPVTALLLRVGTLLGGLLVTTVIVPILHQLIIAVQFFADVLSGLAAVLNATGPALNRLATNFVVFLNRLGTWALQIKAVIEQQFREAFGRIAPIVRGAIRLFLYILNGVSDRAIKALSNLGPNLARAFGNALDAAIAVVTRKIDAILGIISDALSWAQEKINKLGNLVDRLPGLAAGGIIRHETVARLGEGGRPEVVIPLTRPGRAVHLAHQSGLIDLLRRHNALPTIPTPVAVPVPAAAAAAGPSTVRERVVYAPITVHTAGDGEHAARRVAARLARIAES